MIGKKAQEEFVGFALIIIIVAVVLVIFLGFALRSDSQKELVESYEVENFIQTFLQYTTECEDNLEYLSVQKLIFACEDNEVCLDGLGSCEVLEGVLTGMIEESWEVGEENVVKAYELKVLSGEEEIFLLEDGEKTNNYKGAKQYFSRGGGEMEILFTAFY